MASLTLCFTRSIQTIKPHVPLIKFRKGGVSNVGGHQPARSAGPVSAAGAAPATKSNVKTVALPVIEDYQLPLKYRRLPLDQAEIDAINSGGC